MKRSLVTLAASAVLAGCPGPMPLSAGSIVPVQFKEPAVPGALAAPEARPTPSPGPPQAVVSTYAGGEAGHVDGPREEARFTNPAGLAFDAQGNLYVAAEYGDHSIRKITPSGEVRTIAGDLDGYADGSAQDARFRAPVGLAVDPEGNVYVADSGNHRIRKIAPNGRVATVAGGWSGFQDGPAAEAQFSSPTDVALDAAGNLYIADSGNHRIRVLKPGGTVATVAGSTAGSDDGPAEQARFTRPSAIALDPRGNLFVVQQNNSAIRKISAGGTVTTVANLEASVSFVVPGVDGGFGSIGYGRTWPRDIAVAGDGTLYAAVSWRVCKLLPGSSTPITIAGFEGTTAPGQSAVNGTADGPGLQARFQGANSLAVGPDSALYVGDVGNNRIRRIVLPR